MDSNLMVPAFAWFSVALGLFTFIYRMIHPAFFRKLGMMQKAFGTTAGYLLHFLAYTIVPLLVGIGLLWARHQASLPVS